MPALALSASSRAIARSAGPESRRRRSFLPDSSSPVLPLDAGSPERRASLLPGYLRSKSPLKAGRQDCSSEESLPTPPPTSSARDAGDAEDDGIEELSDSDFTAEELSRSARRGRTGNFPSSSSTRSPAPRRSPLASRSPERQATLSQLFLSQEEAPPTRRMSPRATEMAPAADPTPVTKMAPEAEPNPTAKRRRVIEDESDGDDVPLARARVNKGKGRADSDDDVPLSVTRKGKGKEKEKARIHDDDLNATPMVEARRGGEQRLTPARAGGDEPHTSSSAFADGIVDLCSSDPVEADEDVMAGTGANPDLPLRDGDTAMPDPASEDEYDAVAFPFDLIPDEADLAPPEPSRKRPRASVFDLPDFALEPASQVPRSPDPAPAAAAAAAAGPGGVKFSDLALLSELDDGRVREFYEQHWRRGAGDNSTEVWAEEDQLRFSHAPPARRKAPAAARPKRGAWFFRGRGRGRGRR